MKTITTKVTDVIVCHIRVFQVDAEEKKKAFAAEVLSRQGKAISRIKEVFAKDVEAKNGEMASK